jgi:hypothetical protein
MQATLRLSRARRPGRAAGSAPGGPSYLLGPLLNNP